MAITLARIDDRVVHGQTVTRWAASKPCNAILVISDKVAVDDLRKKVLKAAAGSLFYIVSWLILGMALSYGMFRYGYKMGLGAVDTFVGENSQRIMNAINVLGIIVVGTLAAGKVALTTTPQIPNGDSTIALQDTLDGFFPCLLPLLAVLGTWYLLSKKGWSATKVLCAQIVVVIVLCVIGFC